MAKTLDISKGRLASYEYGRAPIRYSLADLLCRAFNINQRWLAEGIPPMTYCVPTLGYELRGDTGILFSELWDDSLKERVEEGLDAVVREGVNLESLDVESEPLYLVKVDDIAGEIRSIANLMIGGVANRIPASRKAVFLQRIGAAITGFQREFKRELVIQKKIIHLANSTDSVNKDSETSMSLWSQLRGRLQKLTAERGAKSGLAQELGITPQAVSNWLSGRGEPSAELTLKALAWVEREEKKRKRK